MPDWDDFGGLLVDGLKALGVVLGYSLAALSMGLVLLGIGAFWMVIGQSMGSPAVVVTSVLGSVTSVFFLVFAALIAKALIPAGIMQLAATGRFTAAFRLNENIAWIRGSLGTYFVLLLTLILFAIISDATVTSLSDRRHSGLLLGHHGCRSGHGPYRPADGRPPGPGCRLSAGVSGTAGLQAGIAARKGQRNRGD